MMPYFWTLPCGLLIVMEYSHPVGIRAVPFPDCREGGCRKQRAWCPPPFLDHWLLIGRANRLVLAKSRSMHHGLIRCGRCRVPGPRTACNPNDLIRPKHLNAVSGPLTGSRLPPGR